VNNSNFPENRPFRPVAKFLITLSEINIDLSLFQEKLYELAKRFAIPSETSEKVIVSIQNAVLRHLETLDALPGERSMVVHIQISANAKARSESNHDWGFFQIERMNTSLNPAEGGIRLIELYLYLDR
jgi:hypothetical protein